MNAPYVTYAPNSPAANTLSPAEIERLARRRAGAKLGWFVHAAVFLCVNALLITLSLANAKPWALLPLTGWGLGLAIHGAAVWLGSPGSTLHERLLQNERNALAEKMTSQRDPW